MLHDVEKRFSEVVDRTSFRDRVASREDVLVGTFLNLGSSLTAEIIGLAGFDWVGIDLEHGVGGEFEALHQLQAISHTGTAGLIRVESGDRQRIAHALDSGAAGVIVPQVRSAREAAAVVAACRYAGERGVSKFNRGWHWGMRSDPLVEADRSVTCCVQIERREALAEADAIAAIDGVDVLFVGPADLSHDLAMPGPADHPELLAVARDVANAAHRHGKAAGVLAGTVSQLAHYHRLGFTFLGCGADSTLLMQRARDVSSELRAITDKQAGTGANT